MNEILQHTYYDLIALSISFLHEHDTSFRGLFDSDPQIRIKTSKYLCSQPLKEWSHSKNNWLNINTDNKDLQVSFYYGIKFFGNNERWDYIIPMLQQKHNQKLLHALLSNIRGKKDDELNLKLQPILLNLLDRKLNKENVSSLYYSILSTLKNDETIGNFKQLVDLKKNKIIADQLLKSINLHLSQV